jgi:hypothetical protein
MSREQGVEAFAGRLVNRAEVRELHGVRGAALGEGAERGGVAVRRFGIDKKREGGIIPPKLRRLLNQNSVIDAHL